MGMISRRQATKRQGAAETANNSRGFQVVFQYNLQNAPLILGTNTAAQRCRIVGGGTRDAVCEEQVGSGSG